MKKLLRVSVMILTALVALAVTGCDNGSTPIPTPIPHALANSVWAGGTPRDGDWLTLSFVNLTTAIAGSTDIGDRVIGSFAVDNSTNNWAYAYNSLTRTGTISAGAGWSPVPDGFSISADGKTLTIDNYGGHGGRRHFERLRNTDLTVDAVPFGPGTLAANLDNSVWAGETPRAGDWLTISFKNITTAIAGSTETGLRVIWSFAIDNSTNNWGYAYNSDAKTGTVTVASGWNPAPDGFSVSVDGLTLTITNYGSHTGGPRSFKRLR